MDHQGLLRVGSKMLRDGIKKPKHCPILLSKTSHTTHLIIDEYHRSLAHVGVYSMLTQMRKKYWIPCIFSTVRKKISKCTWCKRFNGRTIKLNQGMYKDWRIKESDIPFSRAGLDYAGPYRVRFGKETRKVYILVVSCLYTRAINVEVSVDLTTSEFLRSFQLHCHKFGVPSFVMSDLGTQIVEGSKIISNFLNDPQTAIYFEENGCKMIDFYQYDKGHHELGSLVEIAVKEVRRLISGAIRNTVLSVRDFEYIVSQTVHLVNRRPIAMQPLLRSGDINDANLEVIPPELLLRGHNLTSINLLPALQHVDLEDMDIGDNFEPVQHIRDLDGKLKNVRRKLFKAYHNEFIPQMIKQATDQKSRYSPKKHVKLQVDDIVLLKEDNVKLTNMPMGRVLQVVENDLGEVTSALIFKGATREKVRRHVSALIPLLQYNNDTGGDWQS